MLRIIKKYPLYLFLLPTFFVLHGFAENYGFLEAKEAGMLLLSYIFFALSIAGFSYFFFRNWNRAALITVFWMSFFFFFGALHEFLKEYSPVRLFSRYSFLLGTALLILFGLFIFFKKSKKPFTRFSIYLNSLFIIYIVIDLSSILWKASKKDDNLLSVYDFAKESNYTICDTCAKPDIYFLLYDEYSNSLSLKEQYGFHNDIDSFLISRNFSLQEHSRSNYSFTPFSMSSILNMSFIQGIKNVKSVTADDYANCNLLIRDNEVIKILGAHGYQINNLSVFDLAGHPSRVDQSFLPLKTKLISDRTLFAHMNKDIGWLLMTKWPFKLFMRNDYMKHKLNNEEFQELVVQTSLDKNQQPRFTYAHFYMPHPPCFYDKHGNPKDEKTLYQEFKDGRPETYLEYLQYTNIRMRELIDTIQKNDPGSVIVLLSDHGYREKGTKKYSHFFRNLNAVYFPDRDYRGFYDSVTAINQFRLVFNKMFHLSLPLQKDSSIILVDWTPISTVDKPE
jgi:hypothetical protein